MASSALEALVAALSGGAQSAYGAYLQEQERKQREAEQMREFKQRQAEQEESRRRWQATYDLQKNAAQRSEAGDIVNRLFLSSPEMPLTNEAVSALSTFGLSPRTTVTTTPDRSAPTTLKSTTPPVTSAFNAPSLSFQPGAAGPSPFAGLSMAGKPAPTPMSSTVLPFEVEGSRGEITQQRPLSAMETQLEGQRKYLQERLGQFQPGTFDYERIADALVGLGGGAKLQSRPTLAEGNIITDENGNPVQQLYDKTTGQVVTTIAASERPRIVEMADPSANGRPAVYALYTDGRKVKLGYRSDKAQNFVYTDINNNQRVVSVPPSYVPLGGSTETPSDITPTAPSRTAATAPAKTNEPAVKPDTTFGPPETQNLGINLGPVQQSESARKAGEELYSLKKQIDDAIELGNKIEWRGVGGMWTGKTQQFLFKEFGVGNRDEANLRLMLNNIFANVANKRGGAALTETEIALLNSYLPNKDGNASKGFIKLALEGFGKTLDNSQYFRSTGGGYSAPPSTGLEGYERKVIDGVLTWVKKGGG